MGGFPGALPDARTPPPMDAPPLRWGVLGSGWIAERFVAALHSSTRQRVTAIGSRDAARGGAFAALHGIPRSFSSYQELVDSDEVDVVYVATPHPFHAPDALLALDAGKHVLVEKPLGLSAVEATMIADRARSHNLFCAEAMWTFFLPKFDVIRQLLDDRVLGEVLTVNAEYGEYLPPDHRIHRADLAGGPLLDLGTYPFGLATWAMGKPEQIQAAGRIGAAGVHTQAAAILTDARGNECVIHTTMRNSTPTIATLMGAKATLTIDGPFYQPGDFRLDSLDRAHVLHYREPRVEHKALYFEAAEVARCISVGALETPLRPLADSVLALTVIDEVRRQIGVVFPGEDA
jgi:predicted dehydrogenase